MATTAVTSQGTKLSVKIGEGTPAFVEIPQIMGFTGPSTQQDMEDVTCLDSTGGYKEWFATLRDGGSVPFDMIWKPSDATHTALYAANVAGTKLDFEAEFPFTPALLKDFSAYVSKCEPKSSKGTSLKLGVELKVTGAITTPAA